MCLFVSVLCVSGLGDIGGLFNTIKEAVPLDKQPDIINRIAKGIFTIRDLYEQFQNVLKMGPLSQVMSMIPGGSRHTTWGEDLCGMDVCVCVCVCRYWCEFDPEGSGEGGGAADTEVHDHDGLHDQRRYVGDPLPCPPPHGADCLSVSLSVCVSELDCVKQMNDSRILRVAKGSGR